jgi:hypothetical protein
VYYNIDLALPTGYLSYLNEREEVNLYIQLECLYYNTKLSFLGFLAFLPFSSELLGWLSDHS